MTIKFPSLSGKPDLDICIHEQLRVGEFIDFGEGQTWFIQKITNQFSLQSSDRSRTHDCLKVVYVQRAE